MLKLKCERGFVLPLSMILMIAIAISGAGFLQLDFLEKRMTMNEVDNHTAFYLANTGIERGRAVLKIPDSLTWTPVFGGTYDGPDADTDPDYTIDNSGDVLLCPTDGRNCMIPPFGSAVTHVALGTFDTGQEYRVRVFNNLDLNSPDNTDDDRIVTLRALGTIRGQQKVIELTLLAVSDQGCITCQNEDTSAICPDSQNKNTTIDCMEERDPASVPTLPVWNPDFYKDPSKLPCANSANSVEITGDITLVPGAPANSGEEQILSGHCYFVTGNATVKNIGPGYQDVVVFSNNSLLVSGAAELTNSILIGLTEVQLQGNITISSPRTATDMYPAVISGGDLLKGDASVQIDGNIYAAGSIGSDQHPWNPNQVQGIIMGSDVYLKAAATTITDNDDLLYYAFMPGFGYDPGDKGNVNVPGSWVEIQ